MRRAWSGAAGTLSSCSVDLFNLLPIGELWLAAVRLEETEQVLLRRDLSKYVDIFRGTPLLVQAFFIYFGIPAALHFQMSAFTAGIITLSLNAGAYMAEIVRGGILSVVAPGRQWIEPKPHLIVADHDAENRARFEAELGLGTTNADKNVKDGIETVQRRLRPAGDGRGGPRNPGAAAQSGAARRRPRAAAPAAAD